jgi:hypothetical protein
VRDAAGSVRGRIVRSRETVEFRVAVRTEWAGGEALLLRVVVDVANDSKWAGTDREEALRRALVSAHVMLAVDRARFVSLLDPPGEAVLPAAECHQEGLFPVLVGAGDVMLASPIILYDNPEVAAESPGDLYDSTEIDEILALRVVTLTDEEKAEARGTDPRSAAIIDRCESMEPEQWALLHGTIRSIGVIEETTAVAGFEEAQVPWWDPGSDASVDPATDAVLVRGVTIRRGSPVILRPSRRADAHDFFLAGMTATVAGVFEDVDGNKHLAVSVDDDPANSELAWQGRYLYFYPDEVEPLELSEAVE